MLVQYDPEADALYVEFGDAPASRTGRLDELHADHAADGGVIGVEFLEASRGISLAGVPDRERVDRLLRSMRAIPQPTTA